MIELMVVIGIIVVAAGMMAPTVTEFLQNRKIEGVRGSFGSTFNRARLRAVNQRARVSLVFFHEGFRIYDEGLQQFLVDDFFNENSIMAVEQGEGGGNVEIWLEFGFLDGLTSLELKRYRDWEDEKLREIGGLAPGEGVEGLRQESRRYDVSDVPRVTFERDGTLLFTMGNDVSSAEYKKEIPSTADIVIKQRDNPTVVFVDLRTTGQMRSNAVPREFPPEVPPVPGLAGAEPAR